MYRWRTSNNKNKSSVLEFTGGINNGGNLPMDVGPKHSIREYGWSTSSYPSLSTRGGCVQSMTAPEVGTLRGSLVYDASFYVIIFANGNVWSKPVSGGGPWTYRNNIGASTADWRSTVFNDKIILVNPMVEKAISLDATFTVTELSDAPTYGSFITNDTVRVWIAKDKTLYYSGFLNEADFSSAENSGSVEFYTEDNTDITALYYYDNHIIVTKEQWFGEIYGTNYFNFELKTSNRRIGCISDRTIATASGNLYWMGQGPEVYQYQGGDPIPIGDAIRGYLRICNSSLSWAATDGVRLFLYLSYSGGPAIFCYDPRYQIWRVFDHATSTLPTPRVIPSFYADIAARNTMDVLQLVTTAGELYQYQTVLTADEPGDQVQFYYESPPIHEGTPYRDKEYYEIHIQMYLESSASMTIEVSAYDRTFFAANPPQFWIPIDTVTPQATARNYDRIISLESVPQTPWLKVRITGKGVVQIYSIEKFYREMNTQHDSRPEGT